MKTKLIEIVDRFLSDTAKKKQNRGKISYAGMFFFLKLIQSHNEMRIIDLLSIFSMGEMIFFSIEDSRWIIGSTFSFIMIVADQLSVLFLFLRHDLSRKNNFIFPLSSNFEQKRVSSHATHTPS